MSDNNEEWIEIGYGDEGFISHWDADFAPVMNRIDPYIIAIDEYQLPGLGPVSIEVKWTERWTLPKLLERLENQLVGQYLRAHDSQYGIYVLGTIEPKNHWVQPIQGKEGKNLTFEEVVKAVTEYARNLVKTRVDIGDLEVISIDFREPGRN